MKDERFLVECCICDKTTALSGPLERVNFTLQSLTSCPCGSVHATLPNAAAHAFVLGKETL